MMNHTSVLLQTILAIINAQPEPLQTEVATTLSPNAIIPVYDYDGIDHIMPNATKEENMTKCYEPYGCFSISYPWSSLRRPVTFFPESPDKVDPQYCLYTRRNPTECHNLRLGDPTSIFRSNLVAKHKTFFISHGYLETAAKPWVQRMVAELLRKSDVNVVTVDWVGGSGPPYTQAVSNIRLVGVMTAHLIKLMMEEAGVNPVKIHLIGHSLGSHVSGYIGLQMKEFGARIGRITGMDPADPQFDGTDPMVRLDPTDAIFVDIIHTDTRPFVSGGFGLAAPIGHFDVYPNGGEYQPGCNIALMTSKDDETFWRGLKRYIGCNHIRSYEYFTESINSECPFAAVECSSYEDFLAGKCFSCIPHGIHPDMSTNFARLKDDGNHNKTFCTQMGFHAADAYLVGDVPTTPPKTHAKFYLITGDKHPFCRHHYRVTVSIKSSSGIQSGEYGTFYVSIRGKRASYSGRLKANPRAIYFKPGTTHSWVVSGMPVERFTSAKIEWVHGFHLSILRIPSINLSWMKVEVLESGETMMMCAEDKPLKTKTPRHFSMDDSGPCSPASGGSVSLGVMGRRADDEDEEYSDEDEDGQEGVLEAAETRSEAEAKAQKEADEKKAKEEEEKKKNKDPWWKISFPFG
ncbi:pancreatic triacylglycerol lipase-like isoform X2 [Ischnura elegans]|uniref:pancreatic triacylglycerol lipase-like isoform X2 n=1 Tax=Ischnura elegans TaxID=197161 RepID=UPI001ED86E12|nr:pancreatic triacylglycerol lipase-like isoform X2 [Ischnura elegans]